MRSTRRVFYCRIRSTHQPPDHGEPIGARPVSWRLYEDKTAVDSIWDILGIARAPVIILDDASQLSADGTRVDHGAGVVCSRQPIGAGPTAGGDGLFWWRGQRAVHAAPPAGHAETGSESCRFWTERRSGSTASSLTRRSWRFRRWNS